MQVRQFVGSSIQLEHGGMHRKHCLGILISIGYDKVIYPMVQSRQMVAEAHCAQPSGQGRQSVLLFYVSKK